MRDRVDITKIVLDRVQHSQIADKVDVNAVAAHLDLDAIIDRVPFERDAGPR